MDQQVPESEFSSRLTPEQYAATVTVDKYLEDVRNKCRACAENPEDMHLHLHQPESFQLHVIMEDEYLDAGLDRDELAEAVRTNEDHLDQIRAIHAAREEVHQRDHH